jgi:hypothetical protein
MRWRRHLPEASQNQRSLMKIGLFSVAYESADGKFIRP